MSIQEKNKTGFGNAHLNFSSSRSIPSSAVLATQPNARSLELAITTGSPVAAVCVCVHLLMWMLVLWEARGRVLWKVLSLDGKSRHSHTKCVDWQTYSSGDTEQTINWRKMFYFLLLLSVFNTLWFLPFSKIQIVFAKYYLN